MRSLIGYVLYLLAVVMTVLVIIAKYNLMAVPQVPGLTKFITDDHARALLVA